MYAFGQYELNFVLFEEAIDAMVYTGVANSRKEAVILGRTLAKEYDLFRHVTGDHAFSDGFLFFRFTGSTDTSEEHPRPVSETNCSQLSRLVQMAEKFRDCADVRSRKHGLLVYKHCFVGSEVVDAMVCSGLVKTRTEAVKLG